ncbi:MAG: CDP-alcohol phosphatidyltransferase family protein [Parcubacteria group bacterium]|nr:CDP-alcohol phosphatidyltransferase family protein [Parcubacteria group bacterium]
MNDGLKAAIPSLVSGMRLVFAGLIYYLIGYYFIAAALIIFLAALFTDWLDGILAREFDVQSDFGAFWDPFCDKVLIIASLLAVRFNLAQLWEFYGYRYRHFVAAIIIIEVLLLLVRPVLRMFDKDIKAGRFGKNKLVVQASLVATLMVAGILDTAFLDPLIIALAVVSVALCLLSLTEKVVRIL